ncbi:MAG: NAD-dependent epimerase/dehydratase [Bacteroidales bacterium]|nr:NAD-dependent epimerase/dehydratase [Bacteroidales bacterium]
MKILITGATGYIGRHLLPALQSDNNTHDILIISRNVIQAKQLFPNVNHCSTEEFETVKQFNPEVVLHLATLSTSSDADEIIEPIIQSNITFGVKLLSALKSCNALKLFVNIGSFAEYRLGPDKQKDAYLYTATKSAFRHFLDYYADLGNYKHLTLVLYTVYGGQDLRKKIIDYVFDALNAPMPIKMTAGEQCLDFVHVNDVVDAMVQCVRQSNELCQQLTQGTEIHVGTGVGTTIKAMANLVAQHTRQTLNIDWGALPYRPLDVMKAIAPLNHNPKCFDWKARITLNQGIQEKTNHICK